MGNTATAITDTRGLVPERHVVLLGAGASIAALPNGDANGYKLPSMPNFIETVSDLEIYLSSHNIKHDGNIETLYSELALNPANKDHLRKIEAIIRAYFSQLQLPESPTLYDHLIFSLRKKDVIATFNWDPFLYQAYNRVGEIVGQDHLPHLAFLHGEVSIGACLECGISGSYGKLCNKCNKALEPVKLLYPIAQKNYQNDPFIRTSWHDLNIGLEQAYIFTIFGYSAPKSDAEAVELLKSGWNESHERRTEEIEVIDIKNREEIKKTWKPFIYNEHQRIYTKQHGNPEDDLDFYDSLIAQHPRRSCDALFDALMMNNPRTKTPINRHASWGELRSWVAAYLDIEKQTVVV